MVAMQNIEWEECLLPPVANADVERRLRKAFGQVPPGLLSITPCGWLTESLLIMQTTNGLLVHTDLEVSELVWLAVSQDNSCRYCYAARRGLLRTLGLSESRIRHLEQESFSTDAASREGRAIDFARRLSRSSPHLGPADLEAMSEAGFSDEEISELAFLTCLIIFFNRFSTMLALPFAPLEAFPNQPLVRLARPLLARLLRSRRVLGERQSLQADQRSGPFSYLVLALDGLPSAGRLREVLDLAWDSGGLPERTRLLIFAVIARGIGCPKAEAEARRLTLEQGLDADEFEEILAHLGSDSLDANEALILPFARETIRIEAADIQRKTRALKDEIGAEACLEVIGLTSLANMLCRLAIVCEEP
jgi:AhpD family alkylhydroperoxidase